MTDIENFKETLPKTSAISVTSHGRCILKLNHDGTVEANLNDMDETVRVFLQVLREQWALVAPGVFEK